MCNHHHVIYDGLVTQLYTSEPEVLDALIPCLLVALSVIEVSYEAAQLSYLWLSCLWLGMRLSFKRLNPHTLPVVRVSSECNIKKLKCVGARCELQNYKLTKGVLAVSGPF